MTGRQLKELLAKAPVHKYRAEPTVIDGIRFASKKEGNRYVRLKILERAGEIENLRLQVRYVIEVNGSKICTYVADFVYNESNTKQEVVEDAKGMKTDVYKLKAKLMLAVHGIAVREV